MTVMTSARFTDLVEPLNNTIFDGVYNEFPEEWSMVFNKKAGKRARYQETAVMFGFSVAKEKPEGQAIESDFGGIHYRTRATYKTFGLGFAITEEMVEDSESIELGSHFSGELARALKQAKEIFHADIFNKCETAGFEIGDGVTLLSTAHPYAIGGTFSNKLASPADLSEASLEALLIQIRTAKNDRVRPIRLNPKNLIVPPQLEYVAARLLRSTNQAGTANNDVNAIRSLNRLPSDPLVMTYITQENAYWIHTDAPNGLMHYSRRPVKRGMEGDFATGNMHYKATERYIALAEGPRCVYGSLGI
jgi:hypothetical protein